MSQASFEGLTGGVSESIPSISNPLLQFVIPSMSANNWTSNRTTFNPGGMGSLFAIANQTLDAIFPTHNQYIHYVNNYEAYSESLNNEVAQSLILENKGPLSYLICFALFAVILTLCGLGWCFAKCCCGDKGCCKSVKDPDELLAKKLAQKRDKCKRAGCGILFASLVVVFMFGLVCCFVTNEQMRTGVERMPADVENALTDTQMYLDTTKAQIKSLLINNYDTLSALLNDILTRSGEIIKNGLSERTGLEALQNLTDLLATVENVRESLQSVENSSRSLKQQAKQLEVGLKASKNKLLDLLEECHSAKCTDLKSTSEIQTLRLETDFRNALAVYLPKLPNMTDILKDLGSLLGTDVSRSIEKGKKSFDELSFEIQSKVEGDIPRLQQKIKSTGRELSDYSKSLTGALDSVPVSQAKRGLYDVEEMIQKYAPYRYYAVLGVCVTLAFIFSLLTFGIFIGFCGKQPGSEYSNECCSRKTGSSFINWGIFFMFLTVGVLTAVSLVHFFAAGSLSQIACEAVTSMDNQTENMLRLPRLHIDNKDNYTVPPYFEIMAACERGASAYEAFGLKKKYGVNGLIDLSARFKEEVMRLIQQVQLPNDLTKDIVFLTPEAVLQLERFASSRITKINFEGFIQELSESEITSVDINEVVKKLDEIATDPENELSDEAKGTIRNEILFLKALQDTVLLPMIENVRKSADNLKSLAKEQKDLTSTILRVSNAAQRAQEALQNNGVSLQVRQLATQFANEFFQHINHYANFTYDQIHETVGECRPLFDTYNATVSTFCVKIGYPLAGFWFSLTCLILLFVPLIIVGSSLARLYSLYKGGVYESETYYSAAYGDGDTIPLSLSANNAGVGRRPKRGRQQHTAEARQSSSRYDDTAHKAWGSQMAFNNHHTPPASGEYERPPPYYYPGPAQ